MEIKWIVLAAFVVINIGIAIWALLIVYRDKLIKSKASVVLQSDKEEPVNDIEVYMTKCPKSIMNKQLVITTAEDIKDLNEKLISIMDSYKEDMQTTGVLSTLLEVAMYDIYSSHDCSLCAENGESCRQMSECKFKWIHLPESGYDISFNANGKIELEKKEN